MFDANTQKHHTPFFLCIVALHQLIPPFFSSICSILGNVFTSAGKNGQKKPASYSLRVKSKPLKVLEETGVTLSQCSK
jgi:hypothetical protein